MKIRNTLVSGGLLESYFAPRNHLETAFGQSKIRRLSFARCFVAAVSCLLSIPSGTFANDASVRLAAEIPKQTGIDRGICAVVGGDAVLPIELARTSGLMVHCRQSDPKIAAQIRDTADQAGLGIDRLAVDVGPIDRLPYAARMIDVVVIPEAAAETLSQLSVSEIARVLRPNGHALVGNWSGGSDELTEPMLRAWKDEIDSGLHAELIATDDAVSVHLTAPPLDGAGDWSHWEHSPDNNPVSEDTIIKAPYMTQFMAKPYYIAIPSITTAAGGRTFLAIGHIAHHRREWDHMNQLIARNGFNGTILWQRNLPEGYLVHRSAFIATRNTFYMIDGDHALLLDPETGDEQGKISIPGVFGDWKWMAIQDDVLYLLAGGRDSGVETTKGDREFGGWSWADLSTGYYAQPRVPWGFGSTLAAYDLKQREVLWKHSEEEHPIDGRAMALRDGKIYFYCPDKYLCAADARTGDVVWTNNQKDTLGLIEQPGQGLTSTPGFRSACLAVATPQALILQGQTRMNVVAVSTSDGRQLWTKKKVTNNPNAIFVDDQVILGVGDGGSHVAIDPVSGDVIKDLGFRKRACTRLTACSDSFFVRGEGTLRFDRETEQIEIDGAARPACNDGALPANGLLYVGPWQCDCNLSLIGRIAKCSAGDFRFDLVASDEQRLQSADNSDIVADLQVTADDWPTYRGNQNRSSSTRVSVRGPAMSHWQYRPDQQTTPAPAVSAGGLVFTSGFDGKTRAVDASTGRLVWQFKTPAAIRISPTVADGRVYVGSGDGHVYALEAATGRLLWRFRAAPVERLIPVYGSLSSTWPVNSGVLVRDGTVYCAAGIIDHDGTYVYALDAATGSLKWQNNSSGHLNQQLRKGVSVQGNLTIHGDRLLMAGGNQVSPAPFDLDTGQCTVGPIDQGHPKSNNGRFCGLFLDDYPIVGGRILLSAADNVSTKGSFTLTVGGRPLTLSHGGIPPAWDDSSVAMVNFLYGKLACYDAKQVAGLLASPPPPQPADRQGRRSLVDAFAAGGAMQWQSDLGESNKFSALSMVLTPNAVIAVVQQQQKNRAQPQWYVAAFDKDKGRQLWRQEINGKPLPDGLLVDRDGQVIVTMLDGSLICYAPRQSP
jgi:outer membrane protein assembly factor BamB